MGHKYLVASCDELYNPSLQASAAERLAQLAVVRCGGRTCLVAKKFPSLQAVFDDRLGPVVEMVAAEVCADGVRLSILDIPFSGSHIVGTAWRRTVSKHTHTISRDDTYKHHRHAT